MTGFGMSKWQWKKNLTINKGRAESRMSCRFGAEAVA